MLNARQNSTLTERPLVTKWSHFWDEFPCSRLLVGSCRLQSVTNWKIFRLGNITCASHLTMRSTSRENLPDMTSTYDADQPHWRQLRWAQPMNLGGVKSAQKMARNRLHIIVSKLCHQSAAQWSASAIWHISLLIFIEQFGERLPFAYFNICEVKRIKWNKIKRCLQVLFQCWVSSLKASCGTFCYIKTLSPRYLSHSSSLLTAHSFLSDIVMKLTAQAKQANNPKATLCRQFHLLLYIEIHLIATTLSNANMRFINAGSWPKINAEIGSSHFNQKSCMKGKNFRISQYFFGYDIKIASA